MVRFHLAQASAWLLLVVGPAQADLVSFEDFEKEFGKIYPSVEERQARKAIFESNLQEIQKHNLNAKQGGHFLEINEFADRRIPDELPLGLDKQSNRVTELLRSEKV